MSSSSRHHLPEGGAGALAAVRLADVERRGVVLVNDDPRIELPEVGVGIRTRRRACGALRRMQRMAPAIAAALKLTTSRPELLRKSAARSCRPLLQQFFDLFRNVREGRHATPPSSAVPAAAITSPPA